MESTNSYELDRLASLGFIPPSKDINGVRTVDEFSPKVSYPREAYDDTENSYESGFWSKFRNFVIYSKLLEHGVRNGGLWEIGAGRGDVSIGLQEAFSFRSVAVEPIYAGCRNIALSSSDVFCGTLESLKLPDCSISSIGVFDVLEHIEDPRDLLTEIYRVLEPNGKLFVTVPAHQFLFSDMDIGIGHFRRYSRQRLKSEMSKIEFTVLEIRYFFISLVIPALFLRAIPYRLGRKRSVSEVINSNKKELSKGSNSKILGSFIISMEKMIFKASFLRKIPTGLSIIGVFEKINHVH
jgi:SAM-dependent methyltransferase